MWHPPESGAPQVLRCKTRFPRVAHFADAKCTGALAQLGEHLLCKQGVIGSIPIRSTKPFHRKGVSWQLIAKQSMRSHSRFDRKALILAFSRQIDGVRTRILLRIRCLALVEFQRNSTLTSFREIQSSELLIARVGVDQRSLEPGCDPGGERRLTKAVDHR